MVPNRHGSSTAYRYGFQGQEKDDEIKGEGNSLNYTFRMHDPRVGRFFARDPLEPKYPELTPYQFSSNTPISAVELEGLETAFEHSLDKKFASSAYLNMSTAQRNLEARQQGAAGILTIAAVIDIFFTKGRLTTILAGGGLLESMNETERGYEAQAKGNYGEAHRRFANAGEASKLAIFEGVGFIVGKGIAKIYSFTKTSVDASTKLTAIREAFKIGKRRNIAWAEVKIGQGSVEEIVAHSGQHSAKGTAEVPSISRTFRTNVANNNSYDSEIKILEKFAQKYKNNPTVKGEIRIFSEREYCDSCRDALFKQFNEIFPNVKIKVGADGIK